MNNWAAVFIAIGLIAIGSGLETGLTKIAEAIRELFNEKPTREEQQ